MTGQPTVLVHRTPDELAEAACARLLTTFVDLQSAGRVPSWVLTGGGIADRIHRAIAASPARDAVDWSRIDLWWGDERFLPSGDPERNDTQARTALLDGVPVAPERVHTVGSGGDHADPDRAAADYADQLARAAAPEDHGPVPSFDILMLGVGPDGHVASLFPGRPALYDDRPVTAVRQSPKPPPTRVTMTMAAFCHAQEVWLVAAGEEKSRAVQLALGGAGTIQVPAAGPRGLRRTLWLLDRAAAVDLPAGLTRIASP